MTQKRITQETFDDVVRENIEEFEMEEEPFAQSIAAHKECEDRVQSAMALQLRHAELQEQTNEDFCFAEFSFRSPRTGHED